MEVLYHAYKTSGKLTEFFNSIWLLTVSKYRDANIYYLKLSFKKKNQVLQCSPGFYLKLNNLVTHGEQNSALRGFYNNNSPFAYSRWQLIPVAVLRTG